MFNVEKLHEELAGAGLPVTGCDSSGKVCFSREISKEEEDLVKSVKRDHDPQEEKKVCTDKEMLLALWKMTAEGDDSEITRIKSLIFS